MQVALINSSHLHYRRTEEKGAPVVVFANSLGTDLRIWDGVLEQLGETVQSLCYDKRGHGLSDAPSAPYTIDDHISDLTGLLEREKIQNAVICGVSVGGMIALGLAARKPEVVRGLVLCDTAHKIGSNELWNQRIAQIQQHGIEGIADPVIERWFSEAFRRTQREAVAAWRNMLVRTSVDGYIGTCTALRDADLTIAAQNLDLPVCCLAGSEDGATPPDLVQSMSDLIPASRFQMVDGAGHLPCIEAPNEVAAAVADMVRECAT